MGGRHETTKGKLGHYPRLRSLTAKVTDFYRTVGYPTVEYRTVGVSVVYSPLLGLRSLCSLCSLCNPTTRPIVHPGP